MRVNPGKMNRRITLQKCTVTKDALGNQVRGWADEMQLWAAVNGLYGQEYWAAAADGQQDTVVFTVRWSARLAVLARQKDLTLWRLLFEGMAYEIKSYDDVQAAHRLVKLRAVSQ